jgi:hypothetical protein
MSKKMQNDVTSITSIDSPLWLNNFVRVYQVLSIDNLQLLSEIYHENVIFIDPILQVEGYENLYDYFESSYQNLTSCKFVIEQVIQQDSQAAIYWKMTFQHRKLNKGKHITVSGSSRIQGADDKVVYHRDYLDIGEMLYENLPVLGKFIRWIKSQAAK